MKKSFLFGRTSFGPHIRLRLGIVFALLPICILLFLASCSGDNIKATYQGKAGFAFAAPVINVEVSSEDRNQIYVPVYRGSESFGRVNLGFEYDVSASGSAEPEWEDADPDGVFMLSTRSLNFMEGSNVAYAIVRFNDIDNLGVTDKYRIRLTIESDASPSGRDETVMTVSRKLTFNKIGQCDYLDLCLFYDAYKADIYKAEEADIYRVMDPYTQGLIAEEYAENGWMGTPSEYVEFRVAGDGSITYEPFCTGMLVQGQHAAWAYYPSTYIWGKDFSSYDAENKKLSDTVFQLYPVYCLPEFSYGFLNEGAYPITITLLD